VLFQQRPRAEALAFAAEGSGQLVRGVEHVLPVAAAAKVSIEIAAVMKARSGRVAPVTCSLHQTFDVRLRERNARYTTRLFWFT
jgi:hypothetical protein